MAYTKFYKMVLLIVFSIFVSSVSAMDHRQKFAEVWSDYAQVALAQECFRECCADNQRILNVTKHLIGHNHMMVISEINGTIPASWLLAAPEGENLSLFKFLRELYTIRDVFGRLQVMPEGQLDNQGLLSFLKDKDALLQRLIQIFTDGQGCCLTRDQSDTVLATIGGIKAQLIQKIDLADAKKFAEAFVRQLGQQQRKRNQCFIENLQNRIKREIQKYEAGGVDVNNLGEYVLNVDDLNPLIVLVQNVQQISLEPIDWAGITNQIAEAVNLYFRDPLSVQIDNSVRDLFVPTIRDYINSFSEQDNAFSKVEQHIEKVNENISTVALSFLHRFESAAFKEFIVNTLGNVAVGLNRPNSAINVTAVLKSTLDLQGNDIILHVAENDYAVLETYIATFFPK